MTRAETGQLLAFITALYPKIELAAATVPAWHEMLGDMPFGVAMAATKRVLSQQTFPSLPAIGEIRAAAADLTAPQLRDPGEAWREVIEQVRRVGTYGQPQFSTPEIAMAVETIGWRELCLSEEGDGVIRAHFFKVYAQYARRAREDAVLPDAVKRQAITGAAQPAMIGDLLSGIGEGPQHEPR